VVCEYFELLMSTLIVLSLFYSITVNCFICLNYLIRFGLLGELLLLLLLS